MKTMSWRALNAKLTKLTEKEVLTLLNEEREGEQRISTLLRLHQRYTILRATRERDEILKKPLELKAKIEKLKKTK
jgi:DNA-binding transcriptional ArsR family regulator